MQFTPVWMGSLDENERPEKCFRNLIKSTRNQIVFTILPNRLENGIYNLISGWFNKIPKIIFCVYIKIYKQDRLTYIQNSDEWFTGRSLYVSVLRLNFPKLYSCFSNCISPTKLTIKLRIWWRTLIKNFGGYTPPSKISNNFINFQ